MNTVDLDRLIQGAEMRAADRERRRIRRQQAFALKRIRGWVPFPSEVTPSLLLDAWANLDRSTRRNRKATR